MNTAPSDPSDAYSPIRLARQAEYRGLLAACPQVTSDYSFVNIYGWAEYYGLKWLFADGLVWISQAGPRPAFWAPMGDWNAVDWASLPRLAGPHRFARVPETLKKIWEGAFGDRMRAAEAREHFDYVYSVQDLVELRGNKFHKKKNLLRQFEKSNVFEYTPIQAECVEEVLDMQAEWHGWQENPAEALVAENDAIGRVLKDFDRLPGLMGGALRVEGKVIAYTIAERLDAETVLIHFEKGDTRFKGIYQAISKYFLASQQDRFTLVNREQDLGDEGLRHAKMSYNPIRFQKKYDVELL